MNSNRKNATIIGILFIVATVFGVIAASILSSIMSAPDYLNLIAANSNQVNIGIILYFLMAMACAGVGLALYPVLKKFNSSLAIGSAGFRIIESVMQVMGAVLMTCLLSLGQAFETAGSPDGSQYQVIGTILRAGSDWISNGAMLIPWCIAAYLYYFAFYRFKLVPRWLSLWGLIGITLTLITSSMMMVSPVFGTLQSISNVPIALQEMVLAIWLIVKGFNTQPVVTKSVNIE